VARTGAGSGRGSDGRGTGERGAAPGELAGRIPPQDIEVERAVLSALLRDNRAIHSVLTEIAPEDFYHPAHQQLYQSMLALQDQNEPVDLHTLSNHLNERKLLDSIGGPVYLAELWDYEVTAANVLQHARIVRDKSVRRHLISVATEIAEMGYEQAEDAGELLDRAESRVFDSAPSGSGVQLSLVGLLGITASSVEGLEVNLLGLTFGVDPWPPAIKLPLAGRIGAR